MTLETAKRIKEGIVQRQEGMTYEQFMLLNKEAEAVLRGGMNICENGADGTRRYKWIKVKPTKTDDESSIEQAIAKHQKKPPRAQVTKKQEVIKPISEQEVIPTEPPREIPTEKESLNLAQLAEKLKHKFNEFAQFMDGIVTE